MRVFKEIAYLSLAAFVVGCSSGGDGGTWGVDHGGFPVPNCPKDKDGNFTEQDYKKMLKVEKGAEIVPLKAPKPFKAKILHYRNGDKYICAESGKGFAISPY